MRPVDFRDLEVYENAYEMMPASMEEIVPRLPDDEKYDQENRIGRACKSMPD